MRVIKQPRVSVIVPVYNCEQYVSVCLQSLVKQTINSLEVLIVDDGSNDKTPEILERYASAFSNIRVFHCKNSGVSAARNIGLAHANGTYIGFVDADDYAAPEMFRLLYERAEQVNADLVECNFFYLYPDTVERGSDYRSDLLIPNQKTYPVFCLRELLETPVLWNKLFKAEVIRANRIRFALDASEDLVFCLEFSLKARCIARVSDRLYYYRQRQNSIMHQPGLAFQVLDTWLSQFILRIADLPDLSSYAGGAMDEYIFLKIFTGITFSEQMAACTFQDTLRLIRHCRTWTRFRKCCWDLLTGELVLLREEGIVSGPFYRILQLILGAAFLRLDRAGACALRIFTFLLKRKRDQARRKQDLF